MSVQRLSLQIDGMTCSACVATLENGLRHLPGVFACSVNLLLEKGEVLLVLRV